MLQRAIKPTRVKAAALSGTFTANTIDIRSTSLRKTSNAISATRFGANVARADRSDAEERGRERRDDAIGG